MKTLTFTTFLVVLLLACSAPEPVDIGVSEDSPRAEYTTEFVVLVIIDGLRYSEGLGDPQHRFTPRMASLARGGAVVEPFLNDGVTKTWRAIPAIWSGTWAEPERFFDPACDGAENNRAVAPTIFEYYRKHLERPEHDCVYVVGDVGCSWKGSDHPEYGISYWPRYIEEGTTDTDLWVLAKRILGSEKPGLMLLYLSDVDHAGHNGDWSEYTRAIANADAIVGDLWEYLEQDPHYGGRSTIIVTNDHGRHDNQPSEPYDGFSGHGDSCMGCRTIQLLMVGPDTDPGLISRQGRAIPDIAPTIGALLGFPTEVATGAPMLELLKTPPAP